MPAAAHKITFLIGLSAPDDPQGLVGRFCRPFRERVRRRQALSILRQAYQGITTWPGYGTWRGEHEKTLVAFVVDFGERKVLVARADGVAARIAGALSQESVGVIIQDVEFLLIAQCPEPTRFPRV